MQRHPDWPARLQAFFIERERMPFAWGTNDCITFAAADVLQLTGTDLLAGAGQWADLASAGITLRRERGLAGAVRARLGAPLATPQLAQRGDVLLVRAVLPQGHHTRFLAVCDSDRWAAPGQGGLMRGPMAQAVKAWRV